MTDETTRLEEELVIQQKAAEFVAARDAAQAEGGNTPENLDAMHRLNDELAALNTEFKRKYVDGRRGEGAEPGDANAIPEAVQASSEVKEG